MKKYFFILFLIISFNGYAEQLIFCQDEDIMESATKLVNSLATKKADNEIKVYAGWALGFDDDKNILTCQATQQTINKKNKTIDEKTIYFDVQQHNKHDYKLVLK